MSYLLIDNGLDQHMLGARTRGKTKETYERSVNENWLT